MMKRKFAFYLLVLLMVFGTGCGSKTSENEDEVGDNKKSKMEREEQKDSEQETDTDRIAETNTNSYGILTGKYVPEDSDAQGVYVEISSVEDNKVYAYIYQEYQDTVADAYIIGDLKESSDDGMKYDIETFFYDSWDNYSYIKISFNCDKHTLLIDSYIEKMNYDALMYVGSNGTFRFDADLVTMAKDDYTNAYVGSDSDTALTTDASGRRYVSDMGDSFAYITINGYMQIIDQYAGISDGYYYYEMKNQEGVTGYLAVTEGKYDIPEDAILVGTWKYYYLTDGLLEPISVVWYDSSDYAKAYDYYLTLYETDVADGSIDEPSTQTSTSPSTQTTTDEPTLSPNINLNYDSAIYDENTGLWVISNAASNKGPLKLTGIYTSDFKNSVVTLMPEFTNTGEYYLSYVFFNAYIIDQYGNVLKETTAGGVRYILDDDVIMFEEQSKHPGMYYILGKRKDGTWQYTTADSEGDSVLQHYHKYTAPGTILYLTMSSDCISIDVSGVNSDVYGLYITLNNCRTTMTED